MQRKKRMMRNRSEWPEIVKRHVASGLSKTEFCRQEGIAPNTFYNWQRRLRVREASGQFVQVAPAASGPVEGSGVEIKFPSGLILRIKG